MYVAVQYSQNEREEKKESYSNYSKIKKNKREKKKNKTHQLMSHTVDQKAKVSDTVINDNETNGFQLEEREIQIKLSFEDSAKVIYA